MLSRVCTSNFIAGIMPFLLLAMLLFNVAAESDNAHVDVVTNNKNEDAEFDFSLTRDRNETVENGIDPKRIDAFTVFLILAGAYWQFRNWRSGKSNTPYRFDLGTLVLCRTGDEEWSAGEVVQISYREFDWPPGHTVPYQVRLNDGTLIYVPVDDNEFCRKFVPPWWMAVFKQLAKQQATNPSGQVLCEKGANEDVNEQEPEEGYTALMAAARANWHNGMLELIEMKADVNIASNKMQKRALHLAIPYGKDAIKILIDARADLNCQDIDPDFDPNFTSATFGNRKEHWTPLHYSCREGNVAAALLLLDANAHIDIQDSQEKTPLHVAIEEDKDDIVDVLLRHHADVNLGNRMSGMNNSPLLDAAFAGNCSLVEKLITAKAVVNKQGKQRMSALHLSARSGHTDVVRKLLAARADMLQESQCGNAVQLARKNGSSELVAIFGVETDTAVNSASVTSISSLDKAQRAAFFLE